MKILFLFLFFWFVSFLGFIMEVIVCSIGERRFVNRGFLVGPYCPIYGMGALILLSLSAFKDNIILVFILSIILCSMLEYIVSYLMEAIFKVRWWDYSRDPFNINGRICLRNSLAFGILGTILVSFINPIICQYFDKLSFKCVLIISLLVFIVTFVDIIFSFQAMKNIKKTIVGLNKQKSNLRDATSDIKEIIQNTLLEKSYLYRRIIKVYKNFEYRRETFLLKLKDNKKIYTQKVIPFIVFITSGFVIGLICGFFQKKIGFSVFVGLAIGIFLNELYVKIRGNKDDHK